MACGSLCDSRLVILSNDGTDGLVFDGKSDKPSIMVGFDINCDIRMKQKGIRDQHFCIYKSLTGKIKIENKCSVHPVKVNDVEVNGKSNLQSGDIISLLSSKMRWESKAEARRNASMVPRSERKKVNKPMKIKKRVTMHPLSSINMPRKAEAPVVAASSSEKVEEPSASPVTPKVTRNKENNGSPQLSSLNLSGTLITSYSPKAPTRGSQRTKNSPRKLETPKDALIESKTPEKNVPSEMSAIESPNAHKVKKSMYLMDFTTPAKVSSTPNITSSRKKAPVTLLRSAIKNSTIQKTTDATPRRKTLSFSGNFNETADGSSASSLSIIDVSSERDETVMEVTSMMQTPTKHQKIDFSEVSGVARLLSSPGLYINIESTEMLKNEIGKEDAEIKELCDQISSVLDDTDVAQVSDESLDQFTNNATGEITGHSLFNNSSLNAPFSESGEKIFAVSDVEDADKNFDALIGRPSISRTYSPSKKHSSPVTRDTDDKPEDRQKQEDILKWMDEQRHSLPTQQPPMQVLSERYSNVTPNDSLVNSATNNTIAYDASTAQVSILQTLERSHTSAKKMKLAKSPVARLSLMQDSTEVLENYQLATKTDMPTSLRSTRKHFNSAMASMNNDSRVADTTYDGNETANADAAAAAETSQAQSEVVELMSLDNQTKQEPETVASNNTIHFATENDEPVDESKMIFEFSSEGESNEDAGEDSQSDNDSEATGESENDGWETENSHEVTETLTPSPAADGQTLKFVLHKEDLEELEMTPLDDSRVEDEPQKELMMYSDEAEREKAEIVQVSEIASMNDSRLADTTNDGNEAAVADEASVADEAAAETSQAQSDVVEILLDNEPEHETETVTSNNAIHIATENAEPADAGEDSQQDHDSKVSGESENDGGETSKYQEVTEAFTPSPAANSQEVTVLHNEELEEMTPLDEAPRVEDEAQEELMMESDEAEPEIPEIAQVSEIASMNDSRLPNTTYDETETAFGADEAAVAAAETSQSQSDVVEITSSDNEPEYETETVASNNAIHIATENDEPVDESKKIFEISSGGESNEEAGEDSPSGQEVTEALTSSPAAHGQALNIVLHEEELEEMTSLDDSPVEDETQESMQASDEAEQEIPEIAPASEIQSADEPGESDSEQQQTPERENSETSAGKLAVVEPICIKKKAYVTTGNDALSEQTPRRKRERVNYADLATGSTHSTPTVGKSSSRQAEKSVEPGESTPSVEKLSSRRAEKSVEPSVAKPSRRRAAKSVEPAESTPSVAKSSSRGAEKIVEPASPSPNVVKNSRRGAEKSVEPASPSPNVVKTSRRGAEKSDEPASTPSVAKSSRRRAAKSVEPAESTPIVAKKSVELASTSPTVAKPSRRRAGKSVEPAESTPSATKSSSRRAEKSVEPALPSPNVVKTSRRRAEKSVEPASTSPTVVKPSRRRAQKKVEPAESTPTIAKSTSRRAENPIEESEVVEPKKSRNKKPAAEPAEETVTKRGRQRKVMSVEPMDTPQKKETPAKRQMKREVRVLTPKTEVAKSDEQQPGTSRTARVTRRALSVADAEEPVAANKEVTSRKRQKEETTLAETSLPVKRSRKGSARSNDDVFAEPEPVKSTKVTRRGAAKKHEEAATEPEKALKTSRRGAPAKVEAAVAKSSSEPVMKTSTRRAAKKVEEPIEEPEPKPAKAKATRGKNNIEELQEEAQTPTRKRATKKHVTIVTPSTQAAMQAQQPATTRGSKRALSVTDAEDTAPVRSTRRKK